MTFIVNVLFSTLSGLQSENTSLKVENVDLTGNISLRKDVLLHLKISNYYLSVPCYVTIFDTFFIKKRKRGEILKQKYKQNCLIKCNGLIWSLRLSFMTVIYDGQQKNSQLYIETAFSTCQLAVVLFFMISSENVLHIFSCSLC